MPTIPHRRGIRVVGVGTHRETHYLEHWNVGRHRTFALRRVALCSRGGEFGRVFRTASFDDAFLWRDRARDVLVIEDVVEVERRCGFGLRKHWFISQQEA